MVTISGKASEEHIEAFLAGQPEPKRSDLRQLHAHMLAEYPGATLRFDDGLNEDGKVVTNPSIGYGDRVMKYADGSTATFFRVGLSSNSTGMSVYVMGLADQTHLKRRYGPSIGKATVTGYCIRFRRSSAIDMAVLQQAIRDGMENRSAE